MSHQVCVSSYASLKLSTRAVIFKFTAKILFLVRSLINNFSSVLILVCIIILVLVSVRYHKNNLSFSSVLVQF